MSVTTRAIIVVVFLFAISCLNKTEGAAKKKIYYIDFEHVKLTYTNPKYIRGVNVSAVRFGRRDPLHYLHIHTESLVPFDNNVLVDNYFFEYLSNEYRRSFVELHYKFCDLMLNDQIFGPFFSKQLPKTCPFPKGVYHMVNISIPDLPLLGTFPFPKGRLYVNVTIKVPNNKPERIGEAYSDDSDVSIKQRWR